MPSPIIFRSLLSRGGHIGTSASLTRHRGSSWSHLRAHTDSDDVRDIAWHKIRPESLYVREREDYGDFEIIWCSQSTAYDQFATPVYPISKGAIIEKTRINIRHSAKHGGYSYREYTASDSIRELIISKPKNTLIFLAGVDIDTDIQRLAFYNDVIFLDAIHPFEEHPSTDILFFGKILSKSYQKAFRVFQENKKDIIRKSHISYISLYTYESIDTKLNDFFKRRFG